MRSDHWVHDESKALEDTEQFTMSEGLASRGEARFLRRRLQQGIGGMRLQKAGLLIVADAVDHAMHARQRARAVNRVERNVDARVFARRHPGLNRSRDVGEGSLLLVGSQRLDMLLDRKSTRLNY